LNFTHFGGVKMNGKSIQPSPAALAVEAAMTNPAGRPKRHRSRQFPHPLR
jgi:hypothetical protein